jgi:Protein of unknown function (DUF1559)
MSTSKSVLGKIVIWSLLGLVGILIFFVVFDPLFPRTDLGPDTMNSWNLKSIALAMHTYHGAHGHLPPAATYGKDGQPLQSWRVLILPYFREDETDQLYKQFKLDEPWDSPTNKPLLAKMPWCYRDPWPNRAVDRTYYQVFAGPGTAFEGKGLDLDRDFLANGQNTLLLVEGGDTVPWTQPRDLVYDPDKPIPGLHQRIRFVRWLGYLRREQPYITACCVNGSYISLISPIEDACLRSLITRRTGDQADWEEYWK